MLTADIAARIEAQVPDLIGRVRQAADLAELVAQKALPQAPVSAFVLPLGLRARTLGDSSANAFTQMLEESTGILLAVRAAGDSGGGRALPKIDELVSVLIAALAGWNPPSAFGVLRVARGALLSAESGLVLYQLDFSVQTQVRILS